MCKQEHRLVCSVKVNFFIQLSATGFSAPTNCQDQTPFYTPRRVEFMEHKFSREQNTFPSQISAGFLLAQSEYPLRHYTLRKRFKKKTLVIQMKGILSDLNRSCSQRTQQMSRMRKNMINESIPYTNSLLRLTLYKYLVSYPCCLQF